MPTMDRNRWIKERLRFLRERLQAGVSDDERAAIEAEIDTLRKEAGSLPRFLGRLLGRVR